MVQMLGVGVAHLPTGTYNRYPGMGDGSRHPIDLHAGLLHFTTIFGRYLYSARWCLGPGVPTELGAFTTDLCREWVSVYTLLYRAAPRTERALAGRGTESE